MTGEEGGWTLAVLIREIYVNLIKGAMWQLGYDSYCFVPEHPRVDFATLARCSETKEAREKERKEKQEREVAKEGDVKDSTEKEGRVKRQRGEKRRVVEQAARDLADLADLAAWNQRVNDLHAKELEAEEAKQKEKKSKEEPKKLFWPEKMRP